MNFWTFEGSTDGFTRRSKVEAADGQGLSIQIADPGLRSPKGLNLPGGQFPLVLVRLTRMAAGRDWDGALHDTTADHPEKFAGKPLDGAAPAVNETVTLLDDMNRQRIGAPDWNQSKIDQIRLDIKDKAGGAFVIRQIAIADDPNPAALSPSADGAAPTAPPQKS